MLFEDKRRDIGKLADAINNGEVNVGVVLCHHFHDWRLGKSHPDDQIIFALSERAHCRLDRSWVARFYITQNDAQRRFTATGSVGVLSSLGALHAGEGCGIERAIVFAADIKDDANMDFRFVVRGVVRSVTRRSGQNHQTKRDSSDQQLELHSEITSFTSSGAIAGPSSTLYAAWIRAAVSRPLS